MAEVLSSISLSMDSAAFKSTLTFFTWNSFEFSMLCSSASSLPSPEIGKPSPPVECVSF